MVRVDIMWGGEGFVTFLSYFYIKVRDRCLFALNVIASVAATRLDNVAKTSGFCFYSLYVGELLTAI